MKIVIIKGSYKKNGMTAALADNLINGLKSADPDVEIKVVDLLDLDIGFCKGCGNCCKKDGKSIGVCVQKDEMRSAIEDMLACDRLIFATPVYEGSVTAMMKRFCERCCPILYMTGSGPEPRNPIRQDKKGLVVVSSSTPYPMNVLWGVTKYPVKILSHFCKGFGCTTVEAVKAGGMDTRPDLKKKFLEMAYHKGIELIKPVAQSRRPPVSAEPL